MGSTRVAILGFGRIGHVHADALRLVPDVAVVSAGDDLTAAVAAGPDAVIVATPTWTHAEVVGELRAVWDGRVVVEKPVVTTPADVEAMLGGGGGSAVDVVYHAAFAPEVEWAVAHLPAWRAAHGDVIHTSMAFGDAYAGDLARASATLGDSWLDSGINALSVLARLVGPQRCTMRRQVPGPCSTFEAWLACDEGSASIVTTWSAVEPSKSSRLTFADGAVVTLDHQAMLGALEVDRRVDAFFASPSSEARLVQHYVGCFGRLFGANPARSFPAATDALLHRLLLESPPAGLGTVTP